ncbi:hypothetical protein FOPG_20043 [Fusarium oxysporum f. sp. conglutinans race 2 54008]|uniref:Uncharacterized protein n=1 Tax=Fusarium oxysporum f. sp. conglutinans race 2 54008 TaxID=1089457 RepID=X0HR33_FUSOX|nr:hypothetical protein FOPG_20043 [Fusarium oxysporum f. sp. conglutinans race 2 54008]
MRQRLWGIDVYQMMILWELMQEMNGADGSGN